MTAALEVKNLCKKYPAFTLDKVSFSVMPGEICGFIGRNGAGKTTTLKSILNLVHADGGEVLCFGLPLKENERAVKQRLGYAGGTVSWYKKKKIKDIVAVTAEFYEDWDKSAWEKYCGVFALDEDKTPEQLSEGMKVKLNIAISLSHCAQLLILDEPTSGLDPVSREELLEVFLKLAQQGVAILFSTHITSDLEKCADKITYIKNGKIIASCAQDEFVAMYRLLDEPETLDEKQKAAVIGQSLSRSGKILMIKSENAALFPNSQTRAPSLEEIMVELEKENVL